MRTTRKNSLGNSAKASKKEDKYYQGGGEEKRRGEGGGEEKLNTDKYYQVYNNWVRVPLKQET